MHEMFVFCLFVCELLCLTGSLLLSLFIISDPYYCSTIVSISVHYRAENFVTKEHVQPLLQPQSSLWAPENGDFDKNSKPTSKFFLKNWTICQFASDNFELNHLMLLLITHKRRFKRWGNRI